MLSKTLLSFSLLFISQTSFSYAEVLTLKNYKEISKVLASETKFFSPEELLVVFDLDKTVLHSTDCLPKSDKTKGFFRFEKTVQICGASLTSPLLPKLIKTLQTKNYGVMALTARRAKGIDLVTPKGQPKLKYPMLTGTLKQLEENLSLSEEDETPAYITFTTAPAYNTKVKTIKFNQQGRKKILKKNLVIKNGVAMASGANKGLALQAFTKSLGKKNTIKQIIFVDDDKKNIRNLEKAYKDSKDTILIIHYTEFEK